jgi:hypothetical protein
MKWFLSIIAGLSVLDAGATIERETHVRPRVPVMIQADHSFDACFGSGKVKGLDPNSESFLAVRSGPGWKFSRIDKLHTADQVYLCVESGDWFGVVYTKTRQNSNVSTPRQKSVPYTGPCRSGWVHKRWIELLAG